MKYINTAQSDSVSDNSIENAFLSIITELRKRKISREVVDTMSKYTIKD